MNVPVEFEWQVFRQTTRLDTTSVNRLQQRQPRLAGGWSRRELQDRTVIGRCSEGRWEMDEGR